MPAYNDYMYLLDDTSVRPFRPHQPSDQAWIDKLNALKLDLGLTDEEIENARPKFDIDGTLILPELKPSKGHRSRQPLLPPVDGYGKKKLGFDLRRKKYTYRIQCKDERGPNSDLLGQEEYGLEMRDSQGDIIMQHTPWTDEAWTFHLVSLLLDNAICVCADVTKESIYKNKRDKILLNSAIYNIPSIVLTKAPKLKRKVRSIPKPLATPDLEIETAGGILMTLRGAWSPTSEILKTPETPKQQLWDLADLAEALPKMRLEGDM